MHQAVVLAISAVFGYSVGVGVAWVAGRLWSKQGRTSPVPRLATYASIAVFAVLAVVFWPRWQNEQRELVEMNQVGFADVVYFLGLGLALAIVLVLVGRILGHLLASLDAWLAKRMPRAVAYAVGLAIFTAGVYLLTVDVVWAGFVSWANDRYSAADAKVAEELSQPTNPLRSGSPDSMVPWETLGTQGRSFVSGPDAAPQMEAFAGDTVMEPVRVYAGLASAESDHARAQLVLDELERTGGWNRDVVIIWSTTGTGWVDPDAANAIELMFGGNTAIAAMQYSYLPSWISFMVDQEKAADSASALFEALSTHWENLPADARPELLLFGESLGSFGIEAAIGGTDLSDSTGEVERTDGAVLLGPTNSNVLWRQLIANRNEDSPAWRPHSDRHPEVMIGNLPGDIEPMQVDRNVGRIVYYHHPSDPVGYWSWETLWAPQRWASEPIGYDVSPNIDWYPFVSFWHVVFDLIAGFSAPSGYGHNYALDMADVWAAVTAPIGWTEADTERLRDHLRSLE